MVSVNYLYSSQLLQGSSSLECFYKANLCWKLSLLSSNSDDVLNFTLGCTEEIKDFALINLSAEYKTATVGEIIHSELDPEPQDTEREENCE